MNLCLIQFLINPSAEFEIDELKEICTIDSSSRCKLCVLVLTINLAIILS